MKKLNIFAIIIISLFCFSFISSQELPSHYDDYVNDFAKIFSYNETANLRTILNEVRTNTTAEVVIVTVINVSGYTPQEYATNLFTQWGIGKADKDNGLLILYAKNENKIWVTTGYGIEGILPDSKIGRMLDDFYVPLRDSGKINEGIISVTQELVKVLEENKDEIVSGKAADSSGSGISITVIIAIIVAIVFIIIISKILKANSKIISQNKKKNKKNYGVYLNILSFILLIAYFVSGAIIILVIAILLIIILRIIGRNPSSPWFVPVPIGSSSGFGGGGFGGGGFGGGMSGGGGAGR